MRQLRLGGFGVLFLVLGLCASAAAQDPRPVPVGVLTGRITDAVTGVPLGTPHLAAVEVERCVAGGCRPILYIPADDSGIFRNDFVPAGDLRVSFSALDHERRTFDVTLGVGEIGDFGDLALDPSPMRIRRR